MKKLQIQNDEILKMKLEFVIRINVIIKFTAKNSHYDTFFPKLKRS